jgi:PDZ domain-containing protein/aspartyl protease
MRTLLILVLSICWASFCPADEYLLIDAQINDQPVRLSFDTGAEYTALFERAATRLNLEVSHPSGNPKLQAGRIPLSMTEPCRFTLGDITQTWRLAVLKLPDHIRPEFDGILAWSSVRKGILRIDAAAKHVGPRMELPGDIDRWSQWQLDPQSRLLTVKVPHATDPNAILFIDTGNPFGVELNAARWKDWCANHPDRLTTLCANYSPAVGLKVYEECWAEKLTIGQFTIAQVPVTPADAVFAQWFTGKNYQGTLGLFALTRFEVIIDGRNNCLYTRPIDKPATKYDHNRMGAVFVPQDDKSDLLTAQVLPKSPAYQAGIRNGDVLLKIDDLDVTPWRTDPNVLPLSRFWERTVGTKLKLTLSRDDKPFQTTVELKDIFPQP